MLKSVRRKQLPTIFHKQQAYIHEHTRRWVKFEDHADFPDAYTHLYQDLASRQGKTTTFLSAFLRLILARTQLYGSAYSAMPLLKSLCHQQVVKPFKQYVTEGAEPSLLAWSASTGFTAGLCPLLGKLMPCIDFAQTLMPEFVVHSCVALTLCMLLYKTHTQSSIPVLGTDCQALQHIS